MELQRRLEVMGDFAALPDEAVCSILKLLEPREVAVMACVSSAFYILCNEEPLWMELCLKNQEGEFVYEGCWKRTALGSNYKVSSKPLRFNGFSSMYLYRRWCRCNMMLESFFFDNGALERRPNISNEEFLARYDGRRPILLTELAEEWKARHSWTTSQLVERYGDTRFKVSQPYGKSVYMKMRDYADYMAVQHDEDPLYIFDSMFGESAPGLLDDYNVPELFREDFLSILSPSQRPPFRWLVMGPARSGASWHVDPALTSAWNTLLYGRKRWALYPPGRVPPGFVVRVNDESGDIDYDGPTSLQWWLDIYPFLDEDTKPIEFTQVPGETIYVPSGWWHCVLNIDETVAVTQNYVNATNLELACIDMAPGFHHRGIARAGALAVKKHYPVEASDFNSHDDLLMNLDTLRGYIDEHPDHFLSETNKDGYLNKRDMRDWLRKLQVVRPDLKDLIWKCACVAVDAQTWLDRLSTICKAEGVSLPGEQEIPVGNGSSPVYILDEHVVKMYLHEEGIPAAIEECKSELRIYKLIEESGPSSLQDVVPTVIASGTLYDDGGVLRVAALGEDHYEGLWPYIVFQRCKGENLAQCRNRMTEEDYLDLAAFLGRHLQQLHQLHLPAADEQATFEDNTWTCRVPRQWQTFVSLLRAHRQSVMKRLKEWDSVPRHLLDKVEAYLPDDPVVLIGITEVEKQLALPLRSPSLLHMDVMDDNVQMVPYSETEDKAKEFVKNRTMQARYILDFGDMMLGDPLYELIPMHTDVFGVKTELLEAYLRSYDLPLSVNNLRTSYRAMCYCLLYKYDALEIIFRCRSELGQVQSWEELESSIWGILNDSG